MKLWFFLHLVGLAVLLGGGLSAGVLNRVALGTKDAAASLDLGQVQLGRLADAGAVITFVSGSMLVFIEGWHHTFFQQHWLLLMTTFGLASAALNGISTKTAKRVLAEPYDGNKTQLRRRIVTLRMIWLLLTMGAVFFGVWRVGMA